MDPVLSVVLVWLLFAGTHIGMATAPVRTAIKARVGEQGFQGVFSLVAAITFALLCYVYSSAQFEGPAGLALGRYPALVWALIGLSTFGIVLAVGALTAYGDSAYAMSTAGRKTEPYGFERITRHGFAIGLALVGVAHALLATRLTGTVFFVGLAAFGWFGSLHQDAKLHARRDEHGEFLDKTSMVPFAAIAAGRTRLVVSELGLVPLALGLLAAWGIREAHPHIFAAGGLYVVAGTLVGAGVATVQDMRRARDRGLAGVTGS